MFNFLKSAISSLFSKLSSGLSALFSRTKIDAAALEELQALLIQADVGFKTTNYLLDRIKKKLGSGTHDGQALKTALEDELLLMLNQPAISAEGDIYLLVGINGSGKTTSAAKLAYTLKEQGEKVLLVAADTFRAAAVQQLEDWGKKLSLEVVKGKENQDPASVVFAGAQKYKNEQYDVLIVDTAGRLQTKINLMKELEKIKKVLQAQLPDKKIITLLTIDALLGQNSLDQAKVFHESTKLDGIILTKLDGTGKGGIIFAISHELKIPILFYSYGEKIDQWAPFNHKEFLKHLLVS